MREWKISEDILNFEDLTFVKYNILLNRIFVYLGIFLSSFNLWEESDSNFVFYVFFFFSMSLFSLYLFIF